MRLIDEMTMEQLQKILEDITKEFGVTAVTRDGDTWTFSHPEGNIELSHVGCVISDGPFPGFTAAEAVKIALGVS